MTTVEIALTSSDFDGLLSESTVFLDEGLSGRINDRITTTFTRQINEQLASILVKSTVQVFLADNLTARWLLAKPELPLWRVEITVDLEKGSQFSGFDFASPIEEGFRIPSGEIHLGSTELKHKPMATRERFHYRGAGLLIPTTTFAVTQEDISTCECPHHLLHPLIRSLSKRFYIRWLCGCCGAHYFCECSRGAAESLANPTPGVGMIFNDAHRHLDATEYRTEICHLCRGIPSMLTYISSMYGGRILQHYLPYIHSISASRGVTFREAENIVRDQLGVPRVGEGWVGETHLYFAVKALFPEYGVQREASPEFLGRQRFDIYLPEVGVAIEYQGQQHYKPVKLFGGEEGFRRTKDRDRTKKKKAKAAGVQIVEFRHDEEITERKIQERVAKAIKTQRRRTASERSSW